MFIKNVRVALRCAAYLQVVDFCFAAAETRKAAADLPIIANNMKLNQKRGQELRAKSVQGGFKR